MTVYFLGWKAQYEQLFISYLAESYDFVHLEQSKFWNRLNRLIGRFLGERWRSRLALLYAWRSGFSANDLLICNEGEMHSKVQRVNSWSLSRRKAFANKGLG